MFSARVVVFGRKFRCQHCGCGSTNRRDVINHAKKRHPGQHVDVISDYVDEKEKAVNDGYTTICTSTL